MIAGVQHPVHERSRGLRSCGISHPGLHEFARCAWEWLATALTDDEKGVGAALPEVGVFAHQRPSGW